MLYRVFDSWLRNSVFWFLPLPILGPIYWMYFPRGLGGILTKAQHLQENLKKSQQQAALLEAMVEFQKAQCFFMLAIQIAALLALSSNQNYFDATTYNELLSNANLLNSIAVSGFLPTVQVLWYLHVSGMRSWYVTVLSISTLAVSAATLFCAQRCALTQVINDNAAPTLDKCGGISPTKFCYDSARHRLGFCRTRLKLSQRSLYLPRNLDRQTGLILLLLCLYHYLGRSV